MDSIIVELIKNGLYVDGKVHTRILHVLKTKHPELLTQLIQKTSFLSNLHTTISERIYCIEQNITNVQLCKTCDEMPVRFLTNVKEYAFFCSPKCSSMSPAVKQAKVKTCNDRYGVDNPSKSGKVKIKKRDTLKKNYGVENIRDSSIINEKIKETNLARYGAINPFGSERIKEQIKVTNEQRYGVASPGSRPIPEQINYLDDRDWLLYNHHTKQKHLTTIAAEVGVDPTTVANYCRKHGIDILSFAFSQQEIGIRTFITELEIETVITNDRTVISPFELDIYIPSHAIAIEYCGLYWHSSAFKNKNYHKQKHDLCKEQGIHLITIFEDEWLTRREQVKSKLKSLLGKDDRERIHARKCRINEVSSGEKNIFFEKNHIQGNGPGSINIGLEHNDELVACMSFIKHQNGKYCLNRYATGDQVVGGFSKLLKYFQNNYEWNEIVSFADLRWSDGNLYTRTGWELDSLLPPDYYYINNNNRIHKFNYRRKNLPKLLDHFDPALSETQNCDNNGVLRIWDCGKMRFVINNC